VVLVQVKVKVEVKVEVEIEVKIKVRIKVGLGWLKGSILMKKLIKICWFLRDINLVVGILLALFLNLPKKLMGRN